MKKKFSDPYHYIIVDDFIDKNTCQKIVEELDAVEKKTKVTSVMGGRNRFHQKNFLKSDEAFKLFDKFNKFDVFKDFMHDLKLLSKESNTYFKLKENFLKIEKKRENVLSRVLKKIFKKFISKKIFLEMDYSIGTKGYNREPHHDAPNKAIVFLLYLNSFENVEEGGALEIFKYKRDVKNSYLQNPDLNDLELSKKIYPKQGQLIVFLSCPNSIHGVEFFKPINNNKRYFVYGSYGGYYKLKWSR